MPRLSTTAERRKTGESIHCLSTLRLRDRCRIKHYETRPRRTNIRGRVAVHAGSASLKRATKNLSTDEFWRLLWAVNGETVLPLGAVVGTVEIVDCVPVEEIADTLTERERALGDFSPGRFAWVLRNPVMFEKPIPARGQQGWWNWEE